jgi:hypothetical protein
MMRFLGKHTSVRYDPEREKNMYTITIDGIRLGDTDDPVSLLYNYCKEEFYQLTRPEEAEKKEEIRNWFRWYTDLGGYKPGSFSGHIIEAFFVADPENYRRLQVVFPLFAEVYTESITGRLAADCGGLDDTQDGPKDEQE